MSNNKAKIHSILSRFVKKGHKPLKNYDLIISERIKDDRFVPSYDPDGCESRHDRWDFARRYDKMFDKLSDNIVISSRSDSEPHGFVSHADTKHSVPSPRKITSSDEEQLKLYNKELEENPDAKITMMFKVELLKELGRYEDIMVIYDEMAAKNPDSANYMTMKAELLEELGRYEEAIRCCDRMIADDLERHKSEEKKTAGHVDGSMSVIDPPHTLMRNKAELLERRGRYEDALECYGEMYKTDPDNEYYARYKGNLFEKLGRYEDAIRCYDKIEKNPRPNDGILMRKAYLLHHIGRHEESLKCFDLSVRARGAIIEVVTDVLYFNHPLYLKGLFFIKIGKYEDAIECCDESMKEDLRQTQWIAILTTKGDVLAHLGRYEEAIACYDRILEIAQDGLYFGYHNKYDNTTVLARKTFVLYHLGRYDEAIKFYDMIDNSAHRV